jgi:hypothetical protein
MHIHRAVGISTGCRWTIEVWLNSFLLEASWQYFPENASSTSLQGLNCTAYEWDEQPRQEWCDATEPVAEHHNEVRGKVTFCSTHWRTPLLGACAARPCKNICGATKKPVIRRHCSKSIVAMKVCFYSLWMVHTNILPMSLHPWSGWCRLPR